MKTIPTAIFAVLFAFTFLSCNGNADGQNAPMPQDTTIAVEATGGDPETAQATAEEIALISFVEGPPATAPYLANVMPNSWQNLTRLSPEDEAFFLSSNTRILDQIVSSVGHLNFSRWELSLHENITVTTRVYREQVGTSVFFRLLTFPEKEPDFDDHDSLRFLQALVYNRNGSLVLLMMGAYNRMEAFNGGGRGGAIAFFTSLIIIAGMDSAKGILATSMRVEVLSGTNKMVSVRNGLLYGENSAFYMLMEDVAEITDTMRMDDLGNHSVYGYDRRIIPLIGIQASDALIIPESPLRHGIQSAFDGNPATAFVANAGDELMYIRIGTPQVIALTRVAILNGHMESIDLYNANNRIKRIGIKSLQWNASHTFRVPTLDSEHSLLDNYLSYQFLNVNNDGIIIISVLGYYSGDRYNNILIAGLNVYSENSGWIFGDIYER